MLKTTPTEAQVQMSTRSPRAMHRKLKVWMARRGETIQAFVTAAVREKLAKEGGHE